MYKSNNAVAINRYENGHFGFELSILGLTV